MSIESTGKAMDISLWVVSAVLAAGFLISGGLLFIGHFDAQFIEWGYLLELAAIVGLAEIVGAFGLLVRRTAGWSAVGLMVLTAAMVWNYAYHREYSQLAIPIVAFVALAFVAWGRGLPWVTRSVARVEPSDAGLTR